MHQFFAAGELCKIILSMVGWRVICNIIMYRITYAYNLGQSLQCAKKQHKTFNFNVLSHLKYFGKIYKYPISLKSS